MANSQAMCVFQDGDFERHSRPRHDRYARRHDGGHDQGRALPDHGEHRRFHHGLFVHEQACRDRQLHVGRGDGDERDGPRLPASRPVDALGVGVLDLFHVLRRVRRGAVLQLVAVEQDYRRADLLLAVDHVRAFSLTMPTNDSSYALIRLT